MQASLSEKRILVSLAHPDDESFGMGGALAYYADRGVKIHLLCATRGEAGSVDPEFLEGHEDIAALREAELRCAVETLGLDALSLLDYRDSGMAGSKENEHPQALANAPIDEVAGKVVAAIRTFRPQIVITFDPVGGYHHPDHIAIHSATVRAFEAAADAEQFPGTGAAFAPEMLYYNAFSRRRIRLMVKLMPLFGKDPSKMGRNADIDLRKLARDKDMPPHVSINYRSVAEIKKRADECHASQLDGSGFGSLSLMDLYYRIVGRRDSFYRAYPTTAEDYRARDLFAD